MASPDRVELRHVTAEPGSEDQTWIFVNLPGKSLDPSTWSFGFRAVDVDGVGQDIELGAEAVDVEDGEIRLRLSATDCDRVGLYRWELFRTNAGAAYVLSGGEHRFLPRV